MGFQTIDSIPRGPLVCALAVVSLVAAFGCNRGDQARAAGPPPMPPTPVQLAVVQPVPIDDASEYLATIQSLASTTIKPEVSGEVTKIYVRSGDRVDAGRPLVQIDPLRQQASLSSEEASFKAQEAAATYARQQLERAKTLYSVGAISQQELQQAQTNYDAAQSQLSALNARVRQEHVTLQYYDVKAPTPGIVGDIPIRVGNHVTSDTVLTTVDRNADLELYVQVPLDRSRDLKMGLPIQLSDSAGHPLGETTVSFISPRVDDQTQSVLVKGRVRDGAGFRTAQFVRARIVWRTTQGLVVPVLSVVRIGGQPFVYVAEQQGNRVIAQQRAVQLGPITGNNFTVLGGLAENERVIVSGVQKLANGVPVRPS